MLRTLVTYSLTLSHCKIRHKSIFKAYLCIISGSGTIHMPGMQNSLPGGLGLNVPRPNVEQNPTQDNDPISS